MGPRKSLQKLKDYSLSRLKQQLKILPFTLHTDMLLDFSWVINQACITTKLSGLMLKMAFSNLARRLKITSIKVCQITQWFTYQPCTRGGRSVASLVRLPNTTNYIWVDGNCRFPWLGDRSKLQSRQNQTIDLHQLPVLLSQTDRST